MPPILGTVPSEPREPKRRSSAASSGCQAASHLMNSGGIHPRGTVGAEMDHPNVWITAPVLSFLSGN